MAKKDRAGDCDGGTPALRVLSAAGVVHTTHAYEQDAHGAGGRGAGGRGAGYGEEAVRALSAGGLDVTAERVFKTLLADVEGRLVVAVVPVAASLDLKALAAAVGGKRATMADPDRARRSTGYVLGGISPLGQRSPCPTVVDDSALGSPTVLVSAGRRGLQVELAPQDLVRLTAATLWSVASW